MKDKIHCPECGSKPVWAEQSGGDYYSGPTHICVQCGNSFAIQWSGDELSYEDRLRLDAIRAAIGDTTEATT